MGAKTLTKLKVGMKAIGAVKLGLSVLDLGLAIWDMIDGIEKINKDDETATKFKEAANSLEVYHNRTKNHFQDIVSTCNIKNRGKGVSQTVYQVKHFIIWLYFIVL